MRVGLVSIRMGNLSSVANGLRKSGDDVEIVPVEKPAHLTNLTHLVLPGVGAFPAAMKNLAESGLAEAIPEFVSGSRIPFLGICLGLQVLAEWGEEFAVTRGLGILPGRVVRIDTSRSNLRLPHIGWNEVAPLPSSALFRGLPGNPCFYFVHSFHFVPDDPAVISGIADYGIPVIAGVEKNPWYAVQFHPEKSQTAGLALLRNFLRLKQDSTASE